MRGELGDRADVGRPRERRHVADRHVLDHALTQRGKISYAGDAGGILCHLRPEGAENAVIISLTHVRMRSPLPLAASVSDYQKHRTKKLKGLGKF